MFWNSSFIKVVFFSFLCHQYSAKVSNQLPALKAGLKCPAEFFHLCSLFSWILWISSKQASNTTTLTPHHGFDVKTKQYCTGHTDSWNFSDERRQHIGQDSTPPYQMWQAGSASQSCPHLGDILGGWCVQSCMCCSRTVLNIKYYWAPFYKMEYSVLLISDRIQFFGTLLVSVSWLEGQSLFNDVSSLLFLFSHLCIPSIWMQIPMETHMQEVHLDLASFMTAKYVWQWGIIGELLDWKEARSGSEMVPSVLQVEKFSLQLGSLCWWLLQLLYEYPGVEVNVFYDKQYKQ